MAKKIIQKDSSTGGAKLRTDEETLEQSKVQEEEKKSTKAKEVPQTKKATQSKQEETKGSNIFA